MKLTMMVSCCVLLFGLGTASGEPWQVEFSAETFARYSLMDPEGNGLKPAEEKLIPKIKQDKRLAGQGWVEYDFAVPETGWYEILFLGGGSVSDHDFWVDGANHVYGGVTDKIMNVWLTAGKHSLKAQRLTFNGMSQLKGFLVRRSENRPGATLRFQAVGDRMVFRKGDPLQFDLFHGGHDAPVVLTVTIHDAVAQTIVENIKVTLKASKEAVAERITIPCSKEGVFYLSFGQGGEAIPPNDLREVQYVVINTAPVARPGGEMKKTLVREIDCTADVPEGGFFSGGGPTRVIDSPVGKYRESGDSGYLQNHADPSFFAYALDVEEAQQPYLIEVDYPDDALRTFCIGLEEKFNMDYPAAGGVDSGGEYSLSNRMHTQSFVHWPRTREQRILFLNAQNGRRAAVARIRLYRIDEALPGLNVPASGGRSFGYWLEEGDRWATFNGAMDKSLGSHLKSMERWAETAAYMGADTLSPTLSIYQNVLYPSKFYDGYFRVTGNARDCAPLDLTRMLVLVCEKYGLKFLPDFHPTWNGYKRRVTDNAKYNGLPDPKPHLMVSKDGTIGNGVVQPYFNPIYPDNKEWYIGMLGEFTDRYKDSPALAGVGLRLMGWVWESHNGWPSLNWGYEDYTVGLFEKETNLTLPVRVDDPQRFQKRYEWLMAHARERWISWRCDKIADLHREIIARIRQARPDLGVRTIVHGPQIDHTYFKANELDAKIDREGYPANYRECGYDVSQMSAIDGFQFLNAQHYYGRRQLSEHAEQAGRDQLLSPKALTALCGEKGLSGFLFSNSYFEANDVVKPAKFGLMDTKAGGFVGVVNPAGRHYLERYALLLAESDASTILDGGEGYLHGQGMYLRDFLIEYRNLPPERFSPRADGRDPVAVWELKRSSDFLFYLVNRERVAVSVDLHLSGKATVERLSTKEAVKTEDGLLHVALEPYQLLAFRAPVGVAIDSVKTTVPEAYKRQVGRQVEWLGKLAREVKEQSLGQAMAPDLKNVLASLSEEASAAFLEGRFWRARTILENHMLLQVYDALLQFPPFLRDVKSPVIPATAWRSEALVKMAQTSAGVLKEEVSETISKAWTGDQVAATAAPKVEIAVTMPVINRYRITLGHAAGGEYGLLECRLGEALVGVATDDRIDSHGAATVFSHLAVMTEGVNLLKLERKAGTQTALQFLDIQPVFRDIVAKEWSVIGPFASLSELKLPGDGLAKVYPPEEKRDFTQKIPGENGKLVSWEAMEGAGDYIDMFKKYRLFSSGITYAVTYINAPSARLTRFSVGLDYWGKIWLNGNLAKDYSTRGYSPAKGQFFFDAELKPGWNEILIKTHSGGAGNGFWMAVSDPGDLHYANQPGK